MSWRCQGAMAKWIAVISSLPNRQSDNLKAWRCTPDISDENAVAATRLFMTLKPPVDRRKTPGAQRVLKARSSLAVGETEARRAAARTARRRHGPQLVPSGRSGARNRASAAACRL